MRSMDHGVSIYQITNANAAPAKSGIRNERYMEMEMKMKQVFFLNF